MKAISSEDFEQAAKYAGGTQVFGVSSQLLLLFLVQFRCFGWGEGGQYSNIQFTFHFH